MKKLAIGLIGLVILLVGAVWLAPALIDWNVYRTEIARLARSGLGRDVAIDGAIRVRLLPAPSLRAEGVRIANIPGTASPSMAEAERIEARVALWPLLGGRIEFESIVLVAPVIRLERLGDGRRNWAMNPEGVAAAPTDDGFDVDAGDLIEADQPPSIGR